MNTTTDNDRSPAVTHADAGATAWRSVVHLQQTATPDHSDWYSITGEVVDTLRCLLSLADVLARQISRYGADRVVRDDAGMDPAERLERAVLDAQSLRGVLVTTERAANSFWSEISHIATEDRS